MGTSFKVIELFLEQYPSIIDQEDINQQTGFIYACADNSLDLIKLLIKKCPSIIEKKDIFLKKGMDYLGPKSKKIIEDFIKC